jgi:hypothetical protein
VKAKTRKVLAVATLVVGSIGAGAAVASAAARGTSSPAAQPGGPYVFACVNKSGKIDYLEFRKPLPHQCWFSGETLWHWAVVPGPTASPSPSASATASAAASASPTSSASPSASASASPSGSPAGSSGPLSSPPPSPSSSPSAASGQAP